MNEILIQKATLYPGPPVQVANYSTPLSWRRLRAQLRIVVGIARATYCN